MKFVARFDKRITENLAKKFGKIDESIFSKSDAERVGDSMVDEMKDMISKGISPILGWGRFPAYKNPKEGYPETVLEEYPDKRKTPVNLKLTGDFLRALQAKVVIAGKKARIIIGYWDPVEARKEEQHREGHNGQPKRPTIPLGGKGERFAKRIEEIYLKVIQRNVKKL